MRDKHVNWQRAVCQITDTRLVGIRVEAIELSGKWIYTLRISPCIYTPKTNSELEKAIEAHDRERSKYLDISSQAARTGEGPLCHRPERSLYFPSIIEERYCNGILRWVNRRSLLWWNMKDTLFYRIVLLVLIIRIYLIRKSIYKQKGITRLYISRLH